MRLWSEPPDGTLPTNAGLETVHGHPFPFRSLMTQFGVSASARVHILVGDSRGGGHRFGTSRGKSEFPRSWSDDDIIAASEDVANDPASIRLTGRGGRIILIGMRKSISIMVVANPEIGFIVTGFPTER